MPVRGGSVLPTGNPTGPQMVSPTNELRGENEREREREREKERERGGGGTYKNHSKDLTNQSKRVDLIWIAIQTNSL